MKFRALPFRRLPLRTWRHTRRTSRIVRGLRSKDDFTIKELRSLLWIWMSWMCFLFFFSRHRNVSHCFLDACLFRFWDTRMRWNQTLKMMSEAFTSHDEKLFKSNYRKLGAQGMVLNANRVNKFRAGFVFVGILDDKGVKKCHTNQPFRPLRHWENFASCHVW